MEKLKLPIRVGLVGTGFAAKLRAERLLEDDRSSLVAVAGHTAEKTQEFAKTYGAEAIASWQELLERDDINLAIISTINKEHGTIARAALLAGKHVVVEYPLALDPKEAREIINLATVTHKLLHVEHIELLGGLHNAIKQWLPETGQVFYARYATIGVKRPAPQRWNYQQDLLGFPLTAALSRLHRFTDLFGLALSVSCSSKFWTASNPDYFRACLCSARLHFSSGPIAEVVYGKGDVFWKSERKFEVHGDNGSLIFDGDRGEFLRGDETKPISAGSRRGLFAKDTTMVLDFLTEETPLYVTPEQSLRSLEVADAARLAAATGQTIALNENRE